jgi:hypothetical protein
MTSLDVTIEEPETAVLSWGAVIAGAVTSAALTLFLLALGVGLGLTTVSPWSNSGVSATTFQIGAALYLFAVAMLSSAVGGYLAGRVRARWAGVHPDEVYFRDTAHGLVTWALATILSVTILGAAATHVVSGVASGSAAAVTTAGAGAMDSTIDALLRADPARANAATNGAGVAATRAEVGRLLLPLLRKNGDVAANDRQYLARVVAARTGLSQEEAERRVSEVVTQAKQAADTARKAAIKAALWLAAAMLVGAVAAMLGAVEGGVLRDSKWYEPGWRQSMTRTH